MGQGRISSNAPDARICSLVIDGVDAENGYRLGSARAKTNHSVGTRLARYSRGFSKLVENSETESCANAAYTRLPFVAVNFGGHQRTSSREDS